VKRHIGRAAVLRQESLAVEGFEGHGGLWLALDAAYNVS
jgi:hypothetical protein